MDANELRIGDTVKVAIFDGTTNNPAVKLNGQTFKAKRKVIIKASKIYWELDGAVSDKGVPYGFLEDEIVIV